MLDLFATGQFFLFVRIHLLQNPIVQVTFPVCLLGTSCLKTQGFIFLKLPALYP